MTGGALGRTATPAEPQPADHGYLAWAYDPALAGATNTPAASGNVLATSVYLRAAALVSAIDYVQAAAGTVPVAGQNFVGLYTAAGVLLQSVNVDAHVTDTAGTVVQTPITPTTYAAGRYLVAVVFNATTLPGLLRGSGAFNNTNNANLSPPNLRTGLVATAQTSLPASLTLGAESADKGFWAGLR
jgi:hypothetical protein